MSDCGVAIIVAVFDSVMVLDTIRDDRIPLRMVALRPRAPRSTRLIWAIAAFCIAPRSSMCHRSPIHSYHLPVSGTNFHCSPLAFTKLSAMPMSVNWRRYSSFASDSSPGSSSGSVNSGSSCGSGSAGGASLERTHALAWRASHPSSCASARSHPFGRESSGYATLTVHPIASKASRRVCMASNPGLSLSGIKMQSRPARGARSTLAMPLVPPGHPTAALLGNSL